MSNNEAFDFIENNAKKRESDPDQYMRPAGLQEGPMGNRDMREQVAGRELATVQGALREIEKAVQSINDYVQFYKKDIVGRIMLLKASLEKRNPALYKQLEENIIELQTAIDSKEGLLRKKFFGEYLGNILSGEMNFADAYIEISQKLSTEDPTTLKDAITTKGKGISNLFLEGSFEPDLIRPFLLNKIENSTDPKDQLQSYLETELKTALGISDEEEISNYVSTVVSKQVRSYDPQA